MPPQSHHSTEPQAFIIIPVFAIVALLIARRTADRNERAIFLSALVAHLLGAILLVVYHVQIYQGGDLFFYQYYGADIAELLKNDPHQNFPETLKLLFQQDNHLPVQVGGGNMLSTGSMCALAGLIGYVYGTSFYAICLPTSIFAFIGQVELYRVFRQQIDAKDRHWVAFGMLLLPSVVFWSSGMVKEAIAMGGLGIMVSGVDAVLRFRKFYALPAIAFGAVAIGLVKPYILVPFVFAIGAWGLASRGQRLSIVQTVGALVVAAGAYVAVTTLFPKFGLNSVGDNMAEQRFQFARSAYSGAAEIEVGDAATRSLGGQLTLAPLALVNALARPMLFDVRNVAQFVAALEMTALVWSVLKLLIVNPVKLVVSEIRRTPLLLACAIFVLVFGLGVGLSTPNLGSLSRYRLPMMPPYLAMILILKSRVADRRRAECEAVAAVNIEAQATPLSRALSRRRKRDALPITSAAAIPTPSGGAKEPS